MAEFIPHNIRRRHSTDTLSTIDMPAPPYGLVDATQRPGSILNMPASSSVRGKYRIRVGKLEIRCTDPWRTGSSAFQLVDVNPMYQHRSPGMTAITANLEAAIRLGLTLSNLLEFYYYNGSAEIIQLHNRLTALWWLCVSVGAASCEYDVILPGSAMKLFSGTVSWICDYLLKSFAGRAQLLGLLAGTDAMPEELPAPKTEQIKTVERFANEANKAYGPGMDMSSSNLAYFNGRFQMKRIEN